MFKKNQKFINDLNYGIQNEDVVINIIRSYFNEDIIKLDKYNTFDFIGVNKFIELKTRRCHLNKYEKTMIGLNKIMKASTLTEDVYFFFSFDDYLCYWKYDKNIELEIKQSGRFDRGCAEVNDYAYIPINLLQKI